MDTPKHKSEMYVNLGGINSKSSPYINDVTEFRDISNMNFVIPGALTKRPGTSLFIGATVTGQITGGIEFQRLNGNSFLIASANTNVYNVNTTFNSIYTNALNGALWNFVSFVDRLFAGNGANYFKWDGTNTSNVGLPPGITGWGVTAVIGGGLTGTLVAGYGYLNDRLYDGPASPGLTIVLNGITFGTIGYYGLTTPAGYGITSIQLYRSSATSPQLVGTTFLPANGTTVNDSGFTLTPFLASNDVYVTLAPRYFEIFNNQLITAGFSTQPSTFRWSRIGEPEGTEATDFAEVRTGDGDRIFGLKAYNNSLVITKERSFHLLTGTDPSNFLLQEVSDQYGGISHRAMVTFNNMLWFLDPKGIVQYSGANFGIISNQIEPILLQMNVEAAKDNATALHNRFQNEVWFAIPVGKGATMNNTILVFDYIANAWTHYDNLNPAVLFPAKQGLPVKTPFFGGYTGSIFSFGSSITNDNGTGITCLIDSKFFADRGQTTENMYRRFYLNINPVLGVTQPININMRTNFGSTIQLTRTMYQSPYQSRIDFGLSARSIQAEISHFSATLPFTVFGFTFESRYQRAV